MSFSLHIEKSYKYISEEKLNIKDLLLVRFSDGFKRIIICTQKGSLLILKYGNGEICFDKKITHVPDSGIFVFTVSLSFISSRPDISFGEIPETNSILATDTEGNLNIYSQLATKPKKISSVLVCKTFNGLRRFLIKRVSPNCYAICVGTVGEMAGAIFITSISDLNNLGTAKIVSKRIEYSVQLPLFCIHQLIRYPDKVLLAGEKSELVNWKNLEHENTYAIPSSSSVHCISSYIHKDNEERVISLGKKVLSIWNLDGVVFKVINYGECENDFDYFVISKTRKTLFVCKSSGDDVRGIVSGLYSMELEANVEDMDLLGLCRLHDGVVLRISFFDDDENVLVSCCSSDSKDNPSIVSLDTISGSNYFHAVTNFRRRNIFKKFHREWIRDLTIIPNTSIFASCSDDLHIKFYDFSENRLIGEYIHSSSYEIMKLCWCNQKLFVLDCASFFYIFDVNFEEFSIKEVMKIQIGEADNFFTSLLQLKSTNKFVTSCSSGEENSGELKEITIYYDEEMSGSSSVKLLDKMDEMILEIVFSKINPDILYYGGGDDGGSDLTLKKYNFGKDEKDEEELMKWNKAPISFISVALKSGGGEFLVVAVDNSDLFVFVEEKRHARLMIFGEYPICYSLLGTNSSILLIGGGIEDCCGNLFFLDLEDLKIRKLTNPHNEHKDWIQALGVVEQEDSKLVITGGYDTNVQIFEFEESSSERKLSEQDVCERIQFLLHFSEDFVSKDFHVNLLVNGSSWEIFKVFLIL